MQHAVGAVREDAAARDHGNRARTFVEAEVIAIRRGVVERPDRLAGVRVHRLDGLAIVDAMKKDQAIADDGRTGESGADVALPERRRTGARKRRNDLGTGVDPVAIRSEDLRPVLLRRGYGGQALVGGSEKGRRQQQDSHCLLVTFGGAGFGNVPSRIDA